jgi:DNA-directed RNA polymerase subunit H (RpoH/RPB5)
MAALSGGGPLQPVCDDIDDQSTPDMLFHGPSKALAAAQDQEHARVTLGRAMKSLLHMMDVRGYVVKTIAGQSTVGKDPAVVAKEYDVAEKAAEAETKHDIILEAEVVDPAPYTSAWCRTLPAGTRVVVMIITKGNVEVMRGVLKAMEKKAQHVILISRSPLTAYSRKWISKCNTVIEFFTLASLQGIIDQHKLVPRHVPLGEELAKVVRERYKDAKFPKLLMTDKMVQYMGLVPGMIVAINERMGREQATMTFFEVSEM